MPDPTYTYDVFISYSHIDQDWVQGELLKHLEDSGLRVCIDFRDFAPGAPSLVNMENAVEHSRKTLIVLTPDWVKSEWTSFESLLIQTDDPAGRQRRMIPLMFRPCQPPKRIAMLTYVDFTDAKRQNLAWAQLIATLGGSPLALPEETPPPPNERSQPEMPDLQDLRNKLIARCNLGDLKDICFAMGIDYDNYSSAKDDFIRDLLRDLQQQGLVDRFIATLRSEKPWVLR